jgi:hypothetical protein
MSKDFDDIAALEKAISTKYGNDAVANPRSSWSPDKEKEYIEQVKKMEENRRLCSESKDKEELNGFLLSKKLIKKRSDRTCPVCKVYSFNTKDDLYRNRFGCCFKCYIKYVEGREERWSEGWRPTFSGEQKDD